MSPAILVCRGVDCAGLGSAATLVEIEELCAEVRSSCAGADLLSVGTTACTQQCTSSPNVVALAAAAGYDGVLLGRRLLADPGGAKRLVEQIRDIAVAPADMLAYGG